MPLRRRPIARTMARTAVVAGTATVVSGRVNRRQQARYNQADQAQAYQAQQAYQPEPEYVPAAPAGDPNVEQLRQMAELHDQGILSDEEFAAKKLQLLGL